MRGKQTLAPRLSATCHEARFFERLKDLPGGERATPVVREQAAVRDGSGNQHHDLSIATGQALIGVFHCLLQAHLG